MLFVDYDWRSSKRAKGNLHTSFQTSMPNPRSNNLVEDISSSQFRETHGNSYQSTRPNSTNSLNYRFGRGSADDAVMYDNKGNRILPPSLVYGKSASATSYANSSDPLHHRGVGEEGPGGSDERIIFQEALKVDLSSLAYNNSVISGLKWCHYRTCFNQIIFLLPD